MVRFIGCGRSGTKYVSKVMSLVGLDIAHENNGLDGTASCYAMTPPPYPMFEENEKRNSSPHGGQDCSKVQWNSTIHIVREPLAQIESAYIVLNQQHWKHFSHHFGVSYKLPKLYRCMKYWYVMNKYCESISDKTIRIEDFELKWDLITSMIGIDVDFPKNQVPTNTHRDLRNKIPYAEKDFKPTWDTLNQIDPVLTLQIRKKATLYGY
jgi:hypothetical protein